jgi:hypothetical protein
MQWAWEERFVESVCRESLSRLRSEPDVLSSTSDSLHAVEIPHPVLAIILLVSILVTGSPLTCYKQVGRLPFAIRFRTNGWGTEVKVRNDICHRSLLYGFANLRPHRSKDKHVIIHG